jgi:hypothetical protein
MPKANAPDVTGVWSKSRETRSQLTSWINSFRGGCADERKEAGFSGITRSTNPNSQAEIGGLMRILVGYLLLAISGLLVAQTSPEFHSRYGEPDRERFMARPGIPLQSDAQNLSDFVWSMTSCVTSRLLVTVRRDAQRLPKEARLVAAKRGLTLRGKAGS